MSGKDFAGFVVVVTGGCGRPPRISNVAGRGKGGASAGAGITWRAVGLDYAWVPFGDNAALRHLAFDPRHHGWPGLVQRRLRGSGHCDTGGG